jgi:hypothetical protein
MNFRIILRQGTLSITHIFLADSNALKGVFLHKIRFKMKTTVIIELSNDQFLNYVVRFEILIAVVMKSSFFWDIMPCGPLKVN